MITASSRSASSTTRRGGPASGHPAADWTGSTSPIPQEDTSQGSSGAQCQRGWSMISLAGLHPGSLLTANLGATLTWRRWESSYWLLTHGAFGVKGLHIFDFSMAALLHSSWLLILIAQYSSSVDSACTKMHIETLVPHHPKSSWKYHGKFPWGQYSFPVTLRACLNAVELWHLIFKHNIPLLI